MKLFKQAVAEFIGTMILVFIGCGTAMLLGCEPTAGYLITAFAFGLGLLCSAYVIGGISGCHINPAVSFAMLVKGEMGYGRFFAYAGAQLLGAFAGSGMLALIFGFGEIADKTGAYGSNGLAGVNGSMAAGLLVELALTFVFVLTILGVTEKIENSAVSGVVIALSLTAVHILGIGLTGTSVNPARSIAPAVFAAIKGNVQPLKEVWIFIIAPLAGAALAALVYTAFHRKKKEAKKEPPADAEAPKNE